MYIVDIKRTPFGKYLGGFSGLSAPELIQPLFSFFLKKYPFLAKNLDEVILGNVISAGIGMNPARIASFISGVPNKVPAYTVNHVCASGMTSMINGFRSIKGGFSDLLLAGGMESMSQAPHLIKNARVGIKANTSISDSLMNDGLYCSLCSSSMGKTAENVARKFKITREEQDRFSYESHRRALKATRNNLFLEEIISILGINIDEPPRSDTTIIKMKHLKPAFIKNGTVTAANSSQLSDGAALALLASDKAINTYGLRPKAKILDSVSVGLSPEIMGMGPFYAIKKILSKNSLKLDEIDMFEINEAFAAQVVAVVRKLGLDFKKVNINGGAIALGHPLGASGTRIVGSLVTALKLKKKKLGIASLCVGGGQGVALLIENYE